MHLAEVQRFNLRSISVVCETVFFRVQATKCILGSSFQRNDKHCKKPGTRARIRYALRRSQIFSYFSEHAAVSQEINGELSSAVKYRSRFFSRMCTRITDFLKHPLHASLSADLFLDYTAPLTSHNSAHASPVETTRRFERLCLQGPRATLHHAADSATPSFQNAFS